MKKGNKPLLQLLRWGVKLGKRSYPRYNTRMGWYQVIKEEGNWPTDCPIVDSNVSSLIHVKGTTNDMDDWMKCIGNLIKILNQMVIFSKAHQETYRSIGGGRSVLRGGGESCGIRLQVFSMSAIRVLRMPYVWQPMGWLTS